MYTRFTHVKAPPPCERHRIYDLIIAIETLVLLVCLVMALR